MSGSIAAKPVTGTRSDDIDNLSELNASAWHATMGMSESWENDLIKLLQSEEPIHHWVRSSLAALIAGKSDLGLRLKMTGHKALRDGTVAIKSRRNWVRIGNLIADLREGGLTREAAVEKASWVYSQSVELCDSAIDYRNRYKKWRDGLADEHPFFEYLSEDGIENAFHQMIHWETPLDTPDGLEKARRYIAEALG